MPAFATHYIFLCEMKETLERELGISLDEKAAGIGTQGPDIFIFHRLWPPFTIYKSLFGTASKLHDCKPGELLDAFAEYLNTQSVPAAVQSYVYGFILHYALDRNCHPYVYARQKEMTDSSKKVNGLAAHNTIEHAVDTYLLQTRQGIYPPSLFCPEETFATDETTLKEIAKLLHFAIYRCFGSDVPQQEIIKAITDTAKLMATLSDKNGKATKLAHAIERPLAPVIGHFKLSASIKPTDLDVAADYANVQHREWVSPYSHESSTLSFDELFDRSKADALALVKGFNEIRNGNTNGYAVTQNISFTTGLEVTD